MGKMDTQRGQKLTLRCRACKRPLGIFYNQKSVSSTPKIVVLNGSIRKTEKGTYRIHATCKCGTKTLFENSTLTKHGWRQTRSSKPE